MAHRFPIVEIIESWGGNYTVQAEVVLSKYHYHQIRMGGRRVEHCVCVAEGMVWVEHGRVKETQRRSQQGETPVAHQ